MSLRIGIQTASVTTQNFADLFIEFSKDYFMLSLLIVLVSACTWFQHFNPLLVLAYVSCTVAVYISANEPNREVRRTMWVFVTAFTVGLCIVMCKGYAGPVWNLWRLYAHCTL